MTARHTRVAAYALCIQDNRLLLAHYVGPHSEQHWTLPGGGVEHGEDPFDAVVREVFEETGFHVRVDRLIGVDSRTRDVDWPAPRGGVLHSIGIYYEVTVTGGELRNEVGGSTDFADWVPVEKVADLERARIIDVGLNLVGVRPADGHVPGIPVDGLLRH
jgi:8-oxo-dGTP diphosphatase